MPVTIKTSTHAPEIWTKEKTTTIEELVSLVDIGKYDKNQAVIQSSISRRDFRQGHITASGNGFVWAALHAYNGHHQLVIRPEDVWFAILSQVNAFFKAHPKELGKGNILHDGEKELEVEDMGSLDYSDFAIMAVRMTNLVQKELLAPQLREWILPSFSTTDGVDLEVALILMMGNMQKYFSYKISKKCGIPSVTLLGERSDWEEILQRIDLLPQLASQHLPAQFRSEPSTFAKLLRPVLRGFIASFDSQVSLYVQDFWSKIANEGSVRCQSGNVSGWITAFCFWDEEGRCLYTSDSATLRPTNSGIGCVLDGIQYHTINAEAIPSGLVSIPLIVNDKGEIYHAKMFAGSLGIQATGDSMKRGTNCSCETRQNNSSNENTLSCQYCAIREPRLHTLQSLSGWFLCEVEEAATEEDSEDEAPVPGPFIYDDDFNAEAPVPAPFFYVHDFDSVDDNTIISDQLPEGNIQSSDELVVGGPLIRTETWELYE